MKLKHNAFLRANHSFSSNFKFKLRNYKFKVITFFYFFFSHQQKQEMFNLHEHDQVSLRRLSLLIPTCISTTELEGFVQHPTTPQSPC